jgi:putative sigma-54 modulation protein
LTKPLALSFVSSTFRTSIIYVRIMKLQMHSVHFTADEKLLGFIQKKLQKLETFYDRITGGEVFLKLDKGENSKLRDKIIEVKIKVPGGELFVKEHGQTFEEATDIALEALKSQIKKFKAKNTDSKITKAQTAIEREELEEV